MRFGLEIVPGPSASSFRVAASALFPQRRLDGDEALGAVDGAAALRLPVVKVLRLRSTAGRRGVTSAASGADSAPLGGGGVVMRTGNRRHGQVIHRSKSAPQLLGRRRTAPGLLLAALLAALSMALAG